MARIVVGVDASDHADRALRWAIAEARLRGAELEVVHAYSALDIAALPAVVSYVEDEDLVKHAQAVVDERLAAVGVPKDVPIQRTVRSGNPASVLLASAKGADLLVVGARGLGGFRGLLLGSVSQQVATHAECPVVIVGKHVAEA